MSDLSHRQRLLIFLSVMLALFLASLDQTIVGTAMPRIISELQGMSLYAWVFTAYMLTSTVTVPLYGKLGDLFGRKLLYLLAVGLFLLGSWLSGFSENIWELIVFRGIQGLGAGGLMTTAFAIIGEIFTPQERGRYQGLMSAVFGISSIIGPLIGGYITDHLSWRWVFYVNIPIGIAALIALWINMPSIKANRRHAIDYGGIASFMIGVVPMLLALSWGGVEYAWDSWQILGLFALSAIGLAAFIGFELRASEPILPMGMFKSGVFSVSNAMSFLSSIAMFGSILYVALFIQGVLGKSATNSGLILTPMMFSFMAGATIGGQLITRTGRYKALAVVGMVVMGIGAFLMTGLDANSPQSVVVLDMIVMGVGLGSTMPVTMIAVQSAFDVKMIGTATAATQFFRSIGGTVGTAVMGSLVNNGLAKHLSGHLPAQLQQMPADQQALLANPRVLTDPSALGAIHQQMQRLGQSGEQLYTQLVDGLRHGLADALHGVFVLGFVVAIITIVVTFVLPEIPLRGRGPAGQPDAEQAGAGRSRVEQATELPG